MRTLAGRLSFCAPELMQLALMLAWVKPGGKCKAARVILFLLSSWVTRRKIQTLSTWLNSGAPNMEHLKSNRGAL